MRCVETLPLPRRLVIYTYARGGLIKCLHFAVSIEHQSIGVVCKHLQSSDGIRDLLPTIVRSNTRPGNMDTPSVELKGYEDAYHLNSELRSLTKLFL